MLNGTSGLFSSVVFSAALFASASLQLGAFAQDATDSGVPPVASATTKQVLSTEGIVGDIDRGRRSPVLTYSIEKNADASSAKILVDTTVINDGYTKFPISIEFFINGRSYSKQIRSQELPLPIGIDVAREIAPIPFNYTIVATLLHPNRQYVTIAQGAVTLEDSASQLSCVVTDGAGVSVSGTAANQLGADGELAFTISDGTSAAKVEVDVEASDSSTTRTASGTLTISGAEGSKDYTVSGTAVASALVVSELDLASSDGAVNVNCETVNLSTSALSTELEGSSAEAGVSDQTGSDQNGLLEGAGGETLELPTGEDNVVLLSELDKLGN